jgi:hypothetical protein
MDSVYDSPLLNQYINASFIGKKLNKNGQRNIDILTPISIWTLLWTKNNGLNKHIRLYNIQKWSFTIIAMNYEGDNFYPFAIASNKDNIDKLKNGVIPTNFMNAKDEYQFHFLTKYSIESVINESVYGTMENFLAVGGILDQFLKSIGWKSKEVKNKNKNNKKIDIRNIIQITIKDLIKEINKNSFNLETMKSANQFKLANFMDRNYTNNELIQIFNNIKEILNSKIFKNLNKLIDFIKLQLNSESNINKIGYYLLYFQIIHLSNYLDLMIIDNDIIDYTPYVRIKSGMFKYKIINPNLIKINNIEKLDSLHLFPIEFRQNETSNQLIDSQFYITEHGFLIKAETMKQGQISQKQLSIKGIEFILVKKLKNIEFNNINNNNKNNDDDYSVQIYNHEFVVVKINNGSNELVDIATINVNISFNNDNNSNNQLKEKSNQKYNQESYKNLNKNPFNPIITNENSKEYIKSQKKIIIDNIKKGNDEFIDIKLNDNIISPLDLTLITTMCKYLMSKTGAGLGFGKNKFSIDKMVNYHDIYNHDNTTNHNSIVVQNLLKNGLKNSFSPLNLFNPNYENIIL